MINPTYPGVYVREESSGARAVAGVSTSVTAFIGMTARGPLNTPVRIFNPADYERNFGPGTKGGEMSRQVQLFFDNGGGEAWITRIAQGARPADITLNNENGDAALVLGAREAGIDGNMLRAEISYGTVSPEGRFTVTVYRRVLDASGAAERQDSESFANLSMNPADAAYAVDTINAGSALVTAALPAAPVAPAGDSTVYSGLILPSVANDARDSILARLAPDTSAALNVSYNGNPAVPVVVDLAGVAALTGANGITGRIATAIHDALLMDGNDVVVTVTAATILGGAARMVTVSVPNASLDILPGTGGADLASALMLTQESGAVNVDFYARARPATNGYGSRIHASPTNEDITRLLTLAAMVKNTVTSWQLDQSALPATIGPIAFGFTNPAGPMYEGAVFSPTAAGDLSLGSLSNVADNLDQLLESLNTNAGDTWTAERQGYRVVLTSKSDASDSDLNVVFTTAGGTDLAANNEIFDPTQGPGGIGPINVAAYTLGRNGAPLGTLDGGVYQQRGTAQNGDDGAIPTETEYRAAFDEIERNVDLFNLMVLPRARTEAANQSDADRKVAFNAAGAFCAKKRAFLLVDPPSADAGDVWLDSTTAETGVDKLRIGLDTRNSAVFWPRLKQSDGSHQDPAGPMAGLMARTDGTRGVWKAAAGVEATLRGVAGVEYPMSDPENGVINPKAVNALRVFPDGVLSWGARTLVGFNDSGNIDDKYIPVRRTMLYIEESLYRGLRFAVFEPNDEPLWAQIRLAAGSFMNGLFRQGAFAGAKASDAYYVLCDQSTTTPTDINLGIVNVTVAFAPLKPAEFVVLTVKQIAGQVQS